jgi:FtsP/CotA-like multicopper oxidase with cupredoxin domain
MSSDRKRLLVACLATAAVVLPLAWLWQASRIPSSYDVMAMGYLDYGGGAHAGADGHGMAGMADATPPGGTVSVADLTADPDRPADVVVRLVARKQKLTLASGETVDGYTVNGRSPGPQITVTVGQLLEVHLRNVDVPDGITLHWHGVDVPNAEDGVAGVTQDAVAEGESYTYRFVANHVGTYWYHSHQASHEQVLGGLFGALVVEPRHPDPAVVDVTAVAHVYAGTRTLNGLAGNVQVAAEPGQHVRVRAVNTDNGPMEVWSSAPYRLVAVDGYDVHGPTAVTGRSVTVTAGGRADLDVVVPRDGSGVRVQVGASTALVVGPPGTVVPPAVQPERHLDLLDYGTPAPAGFDTDHPDRRFDYSIGRRPGFLNGRPGLWWTVDGHLFPGMPMFVVREGDVVRVHIDNHSGDVHPMHLHGHHAVVLARNGVRATGSPWWFDSLNVLDGESYDIAFLADNPGIWMDHCHNLNHAVEGLVTHLMYEGVSEPYRIGGNAGNEPE